MAERKQPTRTCIACGQQSDKRGFVRFVRTADGVVEVDPTGRQAGRGAYTCAKIECFDRAWVRRRLASSLRTALTDDDHDRLKHAFTDQLETENHHEESDR